MIGLPLAFEICAPSILLKSPVRKSSVGTENRPERPTRSNVPSQSVKKNSLLLLDGPAEAAAVDVSDAFGLLGYAGAILIPQKGAQ